jgi:hypothetical protein
LASHLIWDIDFFWNTQVIWDWGSISLGEGVHKALKNVIMYWQWIIVLDTLQILEAVWYNLLVENVVIPNIIRNLDDSSKIPSKRKNQQFSPWLQTPSESNNSDISVMIFSTETHTSKSNLCSYSKKKGLENTHMYLKLACNHLFMLAHEVQFCLK